MRILREPMQISHRQSGLDDSMAWTRCDSALRLLDALPQNDAWTLGVTITERQLQFKWHPSKSFSMLSQSGPSDIGMLPYPPTSVWASVSTLVRPDSSVSRAQMTSSWGC
jgi:hypothetical protein